MAVHTSFDAVSQQAFLNHRVAVSASTGQCGRCTSEAVAVDSGAPYSDVDGPSLPTARLCITVDSYSQPANNGGVAKAFTHLTEQKYQRHMASSFAKAQCHRIPATAPLVSMAHGNADCL